MLDGRLQILLCALALYTWQMISAEAVEIGKRKKLSICPALSQSRKTHTVVYHLENICVLPMSDIGSVNRFIQVVQRLKEVLNCDATVTFMWSKCVYSVSI